MLSSLAPRWCRGLEDVTSVLAVSSGGVSSSVIARDHQTASFPFGLGRGCHIIGHGGVAHPVSPHTAWTVLRFSLDGFVSVSSPLQADAWRRPGDLVGQAACPSCTSKYH